MAHPRFRVVLPGLALAFALALMPLRIVAEHDGHDHHAAATHFGAAHFATSCSAASQAQFDRALAMLHSFFYPETVKAFTAITAAEPACAIAYWGVAMSQRPNPLIGSPDAASAARAVDALAHAKTATLTSPRETAYIAALSAYYEDFAHVDYRTRVVAYSKAMAQLHAAYPDDIEGTIFYALALDEAADLRDTTFANQRQAAALLEEVKAAHRDHPGISHYIIHSYDYAPLAAQGLIAARDYAALAPSSPHALHMPSHIFSMLGMWPEVVSANRAAIDVDAAYLASQGNAGLGDPTTLHSMDFLEYAYLQMGQDRNAKAVVDRLAAFPKIIGVRLTTATAGAAIPARYAIERGAWGEAAALVPAESAWPYGEAITRFARALGMARSDRPDTAAAEIARLAVLRDGATAGHDDYWAGQIELLRIAASAWAAEASGRHAEGLQAMRAAAALEDGSAKHVAMENRLVPMHELLGDMLVAQQQPALAMTEFHAALQTMPKRLRSLYGLARAAQMAGQAAEASHANAELVALCRQSDGTRACART